LREWKEIVEFNDKYFPDWRTRELIFCSNAMAGEVGEVCGLIKRLYGGGTNKSKPKPSKGNVAIECIDMFVYMVLLLEMMGVTREDFSKYWDIKHDILKRRMVEL